MNLIAKAVSLGRNIPDASAIIVSQKNSDKQCFVISIYSDRYDGAIDESKTPVDGITFVHFSESEILASLLHDGGRVLSHFFKRVIVVKDKIGITPLVMQYLQDIEPLRRQLPGNLIVSFNDVADEFGFLPNTLLPFLNYNKKYLEIAHTFCVVSNYTKGRQTISACWELPKGKFNYNAFLHHLVESIPEVHLHAVRTEYHPFAVNHISSLQRWSSSRFLSLLSDGMNHDVVIRELLLQYVGMSKLVADKPEDFLLMNRSVLYGMIPEALSYVTKSAVVAASSNNLLASKIMSEYHSMMHENEETMLGIVNDIVSNWNQKDGIYKSLEQEVNGLRLDKEDLSLVDVYRTIFSSSLMHPFHAAFIPYCLNELLPTIICI